MAECLLGNVSEVEAITHTVAAVDTIIARVHAISRGRTRFEGQPARSDEVLVAEIERLRELLHAIYDECENAKYNLTDANDELIEKSKTLELLLHLRPFADYVESEGDVLWWRVPIDEPPWVGSPQCAGYTVELYTRDQPKARMVMRGQVGGWPGDDYFTHWTPLPRPRLP